jgi:ParB family chromosome partitioning protein
MAKRKSLGRGLDALLGAGRRPAEHADEEDAASPVVADPDATADRLAELPVDLLSRGRYQPRVDMREDTLAALAESIRQQGIVQPIVVRPVASSGESRYEIVAGERRWRAAQLAGLATIPAIVRDIPNEAAVAVALIENIQRENLNPVEEARALSRLVTEFELTHADAAAAVGRSRATVSNLLRLLELPPGVHEMLERRELDMGHARALLGLEGAHQVLELARRVVRDGWSVRETENAVRKLAAGKSTAGKTTSKPAPDANITALETRLSETLGAAVAIEHRPKGGRIVIRYHTLDELDGILEHIK